MVFKISIRNKRRDANAGLIKTVLLFAASSSNKPIKSLD